MRIRNEASFERLIDSRDALLNAIQLSTASSLASDLAAIFDNRTKHERIEDAVNDVFRALPKTQAARDLTGICIRRIARDPSKYGLEEPPCDTVTRKIVRKIISESKPNFAPKVMHRHSDQAYSDTQFSSTSYST